MKDGIFKDRDAISKNDDSSDRIIERLNHAYRVDRLYKIWFSQDSAEWLGPKNILRLVKIKEQNPGKTIYFVYSSKILAQSAKEALRMFCNQFHILPIDINTTINHWIDASDNNYDKQLYQFALKEIERCISHQGGNMGAASDIVRMLQAVIEKLGIYSDFDVDVDFSYLAEENFIYESSPYLFLLRERDFSSYNNEIMAFSVCRHMPNKLSFAAEQKLRYIQKAMLQGYYNPVAALCSLASLHDDPSDFDLRDYIGKHQFFSTINNDGIFSIRQKIESITLQDVFRLLPIQDQKLIFKKCNNILNNDEKINFYIASLRPYVKSNLSIEDMIKNDLEAWRHNIYMNTVIEISGPKVIIKGIINQYGEADYLGNFLQPIIRPIAKGREIDIKILTATGQDISNEVRACALNVSILGKGVFTNTFSSVCEIKNDTQNNQVGERGDQSWSHLGMSALKQKEKVIVNAAISLQRAVLKFNAMNKIESLCLEPLSESSNPECSFSRDEQRLTFSKSGI